MEKSDNIFRSNFYYACHGPVNIAFNCFRFYIQRCITGFFISLHDRDKVQQKLRTSLVAMANSPLENSWDKLTK